jgi:hypothetical protein
MANLAGLIDYNASPESQFSALPSGEYPALITDSTVKQTKAGTGTYLELTYQIVDGAYKGRQLWARVTLSNPNATATQIGQQHLAQLRHATGQMQLQDSQQLHNIPHLIRVEHKPAQGAYGESNEVREYKQLGGAVQQMPARAPSAPAAPAPAASGGLPWQNKAA